MAAHNTAKIVIASADRLIDVRQRCRKSNKIAEISVPAWPMPIQNTKLVMSNAHPTVLLSPHVPTPVAISYVTHTTPRASAAPEAARHPYQPAPGRVSRGRAMSSLIACSDGAPSTQSGRTDQESSDRNSVTVSRLMNVMGCGFAVPDFRQVANAGPGAEVVQQHVVPRAPAAARQCTVRILRVAEDNRFRRACLLTGRLNLAVGNGGARLCSRRPGVLD